MAATSSKIIGTGIVVVVAAIALFAGYTWVALHVSYSRGERAGYVQKFSEKGWLCKTWEGELQMVPVPGATPEKFLFSVRGEETALKMNKTVGKKVLVHYEQHKGVPSNCFGETEYFVTDVKVLE